MSGKLSPEGAVMVKSETQSGLEFGKASVEAEAVRLGMRIVAWTPVPSDGFAERGIVQRAGASS